MKTRITQTIRGRRAFIAASASFCERCSSVCTTACRWSTQRDQTRFAPYRADVVR